MILYRTFHPQRRQHEPPTETPIHPPRRDDYAHRTHHHRLLRTTPRRRNHRRRTGGKHTAKVSILIFDAIATPGNLLPTIRSFKALSHPIWIIRHIKIKEANTIIPGKLMGDITIGSHIDDLESKLDGHWSKMPRRRNGFIYQDGRNKTYGYINQDGIVILAGITTGAPSFRTPHGNGIASNSKQVKREFGTTQDIRWGPTHVYGEKGISFTYKHGMGPILEVVVFNDEGLKNSVHQSCQRICAAS